MKHKLEVEFDDQSSLMDKSDDEKVFRDLQHLEDSYSLAKSKEKRDWKTSEMYRFEDIVYFTLIAGSGDPWMLCQKKWSYYIKVKLGSL